MGNLGEILYIREHLMGLCDISGIFEQEIYSQLKFLELIENDLVYYTDNVDLINIVYDSQLNSRGIYENSNRSKYEDIMNNNKNNKKLVEDIKELIDGMYNVVLP